MQREIEFRAWNKEEKKMYYDAQDAYDYLGDFPATSFGSILKYPDIWHVMQFTGLKDAKGREIYEGDIVQNPGGFNFAIAFNGGSFVPSYRGQPYWHSQFEVIGNIYETPSLLTI